MPRAKRTETADSGARDAAAKERAKLVIDSQLAEEAQMHATIDAVNDRIDSLGTGVPASIVVNGNQGRPI